VEASKVPVGGGVVIKPEKVVVTQPVAATFKAFSTVCTHKGCDVSTVTGGTINCPCHGSKYNLADGSPTAGPAPRPLPAVQITHAGGWILRA
jgi:Rieske Fe-S protein